MPSSSRRSASSRSTGTLGPSARSDALELLRARGADRLDGDLRPVLGMDSEAAADVDRGAGDGDLERLLDTLPDHRLDGPGAIADDEPEPLSAVAPLAKLALPNPEHGLDDLPVGEVAHPGALRAAGRVPTVGGALGSGRLLAQ